MIINYEIYEKKIEIANIKITEYKTAKLELNELF